jgi:hypothetical protein
MSTLRDLAAEKTRTHRMQFIGTELDGITLHTPAALASANRTSVLTENFLPIELTASLPANQLVRVQVTAIAAGNTLRASLTPSTTSASDSQFIPLPITERSAFETTF